MNRWAGPVALLLAATLAPLLAPRALRDAGWVPDAAVLAAVLVAFRATPERAALFGIALGLAAALFSPEPLLFRPWLLGTVAWAASHAGTAFHQDSAPVRMACAAASLLAVRTAEHVAAALSGASAAWSGSGSGRAAAAALLGAAVTAVAAPLVFALALRWRLVSPLERTFRDV